jgi:hypothetical protein
MGEGADADAEVRIPRSALGSVQRALACVHAQALAGRRAAAAATGGEPAALPAPGYRSALMPQLSRLGPQA